MKAVTSMFAQTAARADFLRRGVLSAAAAALLAGAAPHATAQPEAEAEELYDPVAIHLYWRQDPTTTMPYLPIPLETLGPED